MAQQHLADRMLSLQQHRLQLLRLRSPAVVQMAQLSLVPPARPLPAAAPQQLPAASRWCPALAQPVGSWMPVPCDMG